MAVYCFGCLKCFTDYIYFIGFIDCFLLQKATEENKLRLSFSNGVTHNSCLSRRAVPGPAQE